MKVFEYTNKQQVRELITFHNASSFYIVLDLETTGLDPFKDEITDIVITGYSIDEAVIFPLTFIQELAELHIPLVLQNFKFDFKFLAKHNVHPGLRHDTMLLDHLIDENQSHGLDDIVKRRYNDNYKEIFWSKYKNYTDASREDQIQYAGKDVIYTRKVYEDSLKELQFLEVPFSLLEHVRQLAITLYKLECEGLGLDLDYLYKIKIELEASILEHKTKMRILCELECSLVENQSFEEELDKRKTPKGKANVKFEPFNFDSQKQLCNLIYNKLKLPVQLSKTKQRTVDDAALEQLESLHPLIRRLREYRGDQKLLTAFIIGSLEKMHGGRIYPSFSVNGTVTGRISSSNPNMQQLPKTGSIRGIYIPRERYSYISCDYSQLEVTLAAHFSRDENLLRIVYEGASQHDITAQGLQISRSLAKTINFALQYGAGAKKIQTILGGTYQDAELALTKYWETYRGLRAFVQECHKKVETGQALVSPFGRRRNFPTEFETHWDLERAKRQAANSIIQGTGADITNRAFYLVNDALLKKNLGKALFTIHDEILCEVKDEAVTASRDIIQNIMIDVGKQIKLTVPLSVECSQGMKRWSKS